MIKRVYFYSATVYQLAGSNKHIDGVVVVKSFFADPRGAWYEARRDILATMKTEDSTQIHIEAFNRI